MQNNIFCFLSWPRFQLYYYHYFLIRNKCVIFGSDSAWYTTQPVWKLSIIIIIIYLLEFFTSVIYIQKPAPCLDRFTV